MPIKILLRLTLCLLITGFGGADAQADDAAPFALSSGHWSAVGQPATTSSVAAVTAPDSPVKPALPTVQPVTVIAAPTRAVQMPVMPGVGTSFQLEAKSTAERAPVTAAAEEAPAPVFAEKNWRQAATAARLDAIASAKTNGDDNVPLNIRLSFLPDPKVAPLPAVQAAAHPHPKNLPVTAASVKKPPAADTAACAAVDQYKKHQLAALQSDRQTLEALQAAIGELGLQKQLGYLTGMSPAANVQAAVASDAKAPDNASAQGQP